MSAQSQVCDFPIEELLDFVFEGNFEGRYLCVLHNGMIDDSADRNREKVVISAALIGNAGEWQKLRGAWRERLNQDELAYFKSSHCRTLNGQFHKFRSDPQGRDKADHIAEDLDAIIKGSETLGIACIIPVPLWKRLQADPQYAPVVTHDPYMWAVQTVWMLCAETMLKMGRGHVITFAHDDSSNFEFMRGLYKLFKKRNPKYGRVLAEFIPLDDKTNPPIQAADVAASVTQQLAVEWIDEPLAPELKLKRLEENMYQIARWDERFARAALDESLAFRFATAKDNGGT